MVTDAQVRKLRPLPGPGPTYAYYDVPVKKPLKFQEAAVGSARSAVWD